MKILFYYIGFALLCSNMFSLIMQINSLGKKSDHKTFPIVVISLNTIDLSYGMYIIILCVSDVYYRSHFAYHEKQWRSNVICFSAFTIVLNFSLLSPLLLCFLSYTRLLVVLNPLNVKSRDKSHVIRWICAIISLSTTFSIIITIIMMHFQSEIPLHICSPFVDPSNSIIFIKIITWSTVIFQFSPVIFIMLVYILLFQTIKKITRRFTFANVR